MNVRRLLDRFARSDEHARREIDDEIDAHLEARVEYLAGRGMPRDAARDEALRRFGDLDATRAALLAHRRRATIADRVEQVAQDVRYVSRGLARTPAFTAGVVATLALGLGVNSAVFRVADHVLFKPPAGVSRPLEIRRVEASMSFPGAPPQRATMFSYGEARALVESAAFAGAAMYSAPRIERDASGRDVAVSAVDARLLPLLGVHPIAGRAFEAREAEPDAGDAVAVVSFAYWRGPLGGAAPDGRTLVTLGDRAYRVIGVAPRGFTGIDLEPADVWLPLGAADFGRGIVNGVVIPWYRSEMLRALRVVGRRVPGDTDRVLAEKLDASFASLDARTEGAPRTAVLHPIVPVGDSTRNQDAQRLLRGLTLVAGVVLLIACANAMNLLLARGIRRQQEIGIRMAVGASRARVCRLLMVESLLLALLGGAAATVCGYWTADALRRLIFPDARWAIGANDLRTFCFTGGLALLAGLTAGLAPALQATNARRVGALKTGRTRGASRARTTRAALIVAQTAFSLALLVTSGLLVLSLVRLNAVNLGFNAGGLVSASTGRLDRNGSVIQELAPRLRSNPMVRGVALASVAVFGATSMMDITVPGSPYVPASDRDFPQFNVVSANYFSVMGTRVIRGRGFEPRDEAGAEAVAVVNESMARRYWGAGSPLAMCIMPPSGLCHRVIGVVEDVRDTPGGAAPMRFYLPLGPQTDPPTALIARTDADNVSAVASAMRLSVPAGQRANIDVAADRLVRALRPWRTATLLFLMLGAVALALASVGIYSVTTSLVSERIHEFGVRVALGATGGDIVRLVVRDGARLILAGGALGLLGAEGIGRGVETLLFDVAPFEPAIYGLGLVSLASVALGAMLPPAVHAARVDPVTALRTE